MVVPQAVAAYSVPSVFDIPHKRSGYTVLLGPWMVVRRTGLVCGPHALLTHDQVWQRLMAERASDRGQHHMVSCHHSELLLAAATREDA